MWYSVHWNAPWAPACRRRAAHSGRSTRPAMSRSTGWRPWVDRAHAARPTRAYVAEGDALNPLRPRLPARLDVNYAAPAAAMLGGLLLFIALVQVSWSFLAIFHPAEVNYSEAIVY